MARSTTLIGAAAIALAAAMAATMANGASIPSSPAEKAATAELNRKITEKNAAEEARARQLQIQYQQELQAYEQQKAQYEQQVRNAQFNTEKQLPPPQN